MTDRRGSRNPRRLGQRLRERWLRNRGWTGLNGLDRRVAAYLPKHGFFVEAGANDGIEQSNTYYLEKTRRWRGLLVEPVPRLAAACRQNRRATVVNAALVPPELDGQTVELVDVDLMSIVSGARGSTEADEQHVVAGERVQAIARQVAQAPGRTLSGLLAELGDPSIDFLSLDVEGYEVEALEGLDLRRHPPAFLLIEFWTEERLEAIGRILGPRYELLELLTDHDALFRRPGARGGV